MAHSHQRDFVRILSESLPEFFNDVRVLEIGSLDISGSVRDFFNAREYTGIDIGPGKGVDVVCEGQKYDAPDSSFDQVISCETMEHNPYWIATFKNMIRMCKPGGLVTMTCATTGRHEHGTSCTDAKSSPLTTEAGWNYYRNLTAKDFRKEIAIDESFAIHSFFSNWANYDLYFIGIKAAGNSNSLQASSIEGFKTARAAILEHLKKTNNLKIHKFRSLAAPILGDRWFDRMRRIAETVKYIGQFLKSR